MIYNSVNLKDYFKVLDKDVYMTSYCLDNSEEYSFNNKRRAVIILPGGSYNFTSDREAEPVAIKFLSNNINAFVLRYNVQPFTFPYPLIEVYAAIAYLKEHADEYHVDVNHIGIVGFSAGGHLAASVACYKDDPYYANLIERDVDELNIDFVVLAYPVIYMDERGCEMYTKNNMSHGDPELEDYFSIDKHVTSLFPRTYIWTTKADTVVDYRNSVALQDALNLVGVDNTLVLYEFGEHGGATCDDMSCRETQAEELKDASNWINDASNFIKRD